jgi:hypothetical protein
MTMYPGIPNYYISIAAGGYDDPTMRAIPDNFTWERSMVSTNANRPGWVSMNHAFFPFSPYVMRASMVPLSLFGLNDLATATLAGVLVSMLGTLGAMIALYDLARAEMGESTGLRAAFYLLIWPAGMFPAQVYTKVYSSACRLARWRWRGGGTGSGRDCSPPALPGPARGRAAPAAAALVLVVR